MTRRVLVQCHRCGAKAGGNVERGRVTWTEVAHHADHDNGQLLHAECGGRLKGFDIAEAGR